MPLTSPKPTSWLSRAPATIAMSLTREAAKQDATPPRSDAARTKTTARFGRDRTGILSGRPASGPRARSDRTLAGRAERGRKASGWNPGWAVSLMGEFRGTILEGGDFLPDAQDPSFALVIGDGAA